MWRREPGRPAWNSVRAGLELRPSVFSRLLIRGGALGAPAWVAVSSVCGPQFLGGAWTLALGGRPVPRSLATDPWTLFAGASRSRRLPRMMACE